MDDTLAILASLIWVLALGMWPVGLFFAGCSPCCGETQDECPWLLEFDRCLRYSFVGTSPPDGGDCRLQLRRSLSGTTPMMSSTLASGSVQIFSVQSRISIAVVVYIFGGSSRVPVGQTRSAVYRIMRADIPSADTEPYDLIGPPWHLQVDLTVTGVATNAEAGVVSSIDTDEHGQPKLVLNIRQGSLDINYRQNVELRPTGLQRHHQQQPGGTFYLLRENVVSATFVSGDQALASATSVAKDTGLTVLERAISVRITGLCVSTQNMRGTFFDDETVAGFLSGSRDIVVNSDFGQASLRVLPDNLLCEMSPVIGIGSLLGIYPAEIYADAPADSGVQWCQSPPTFALKPLGPASLQWDFPLYISPSTDGIGFRAVQISSFFSGRTMLWHLQQGPYRTSLTGSGPLPTSGSWTYRLYGGQSTLNPFFLAPYTTGTLPTCRPGLMSTYFWGGMFLNAPAGTCIPGEVSTRVSGTVTVYGYLSSQLTTNTSHCNEEPAWIENIDVDVPVNLVYSNTALRYENSSSEYLHWFTWNGRPANVKVVLWATASAAYDPCSVPAAVTLSGGARWAGLGEWVFFESADGSYTYGGWSMSKNARDSVCDGAARVGDLPVEQRQITVAHRMRKVCGPWAPSLLPAAGGTISRTCDITDGEVSAGTVIEEQTYGKNSSRFAVAQMAAAEGVIQEGQPCQLLGLSSLSLSPPQISPATIFSAPTAGQCFWFLPYSGPPGTGPSATGLASSNPNSIPCDGCTPSVLIVSGEENAGVRYITSGDKRGTVEVVARRTWLGGQGVTFTVACGNDTITQTIRRSDTVPEAVTSLTATRGPCGTATLAWAAPHDGGQPIVNYTVQYRPLGTSTYITLVRPASTATTATIPGLLRVGYEFRVRAENSVGNGAFTTVSIGFILGPPTNLAASRSPCEKVTLTWTPPAQDACIVVASYRIDYRVVNAFSWTTFGAVAGDATTAVVDGLLPATAYQFRVVRIDDANTTSASTSVQLGSTPAVPTSVAGVPGDGQVTLTWSAAEDACVVNTNYTIQFRAVTAFSYTTFGDTNSTAKSAVVTGLTNGIQYRFRVRAINSVGSSSYSLESSPVTPTG